MVQKGQALLVPAVQMRNPRVVEFKELAPNQRMEV